MGLHSVLRFVIRFFFFSFPLSIMPLRSIPGSALGPLHVFLSVASLSDFLWSYDFQYQLHNDDCLVFISKFLEI